MSGLFAIITDSGNAVMVAPPEGDRAVLLFTANDKAETFIGDSPAEPMRPEQLTPGTVNHWIANMRMAGARFVLIDPPPGGDTTGARRTSLGDVRSMVLQNFPQQLPNSQ